jgi:DNA-binding MarR family transcriptional regulator
LPDFETKLNALLVDIYNSISKYEEKSLKSLSDNTVTATEAHIIEAVAALGDAEDGIDRTDDITVSDIAAALNVAVPTATVAIKKLESKGLLTKTQSATDGRRSVIRLTELGIKMNRAHMYFHRKMVKNVGYDMTAEEKEVLLSATAKLGKFLKEKADEAAVQNIQEKVVFDEH